MLKAAFKFYSTGGGVLSVTPRAVDSTTKKFAEKQMMVVRFDSVHTDSEFRKVSSGMCGQLVVRFDSDRFPDNF